MTNKVCKIFVNKEGKQERERRTIRKVAFNSYVMTSTSSPALMNVPSKPCWTVGVFKHDKIIDVFALTKPNTIIGRSRDQADIVLDHQSISRKHAQLFFGQKDCKLYVVCLGATHGTVINDAIILKKDDPVELQVGDKLRFGKSSCHYIIQNERTTADEKYVHSSNGSLQINECNKEDEESSDDDFGPKLPASNICTNALKVDHKPSLPIDAIEVLTSKSSAAEIKLERAEQLKFENLYRIPVSHEITLGGHNKPIPCLSVETAGNRVVTCSRDSTVQIFDFGGMDSSHRAFRVITPQAGISVNYIAHSCTGEAFVVALSNSQPLVYSREGVEQLKFCKGDMYLRDLSHTKGHTTETTCASWHPKLKDVLLTGALDGTIRSWDLTAPLHLNMLQCKTVFKVKAPAGQFARVGVTSCCFSFDGKLAVAGCADGSIHVWEVGLPSRARAVIRPCTESSCAIVCVATVAYAASPEEKTIYNSLIRNTGGILACRAQNGDVLLYHLTSVSAPNAVPFRIFKGCANDSPAANFAFSPDERVICIPAAAGAAGRASLCFYLTEGAELEAREPSLRFAIEDIRKPSYVSWNKETQQIFVASAEGFVRVLYSPGVSKKGAVLTAGRPTTRREQEVVMSITDADTITHNVKRHRDAEYAPERPPLRAHVSETSTAYQATQFIMQKAKVRDEE